MPSRYPYKKGLLSLAVSLTLIFLLSQPLRSLSLADEGLVYASISAGKTPAMPRKESSLPLARGRFLVARGDMRDPFFSGTVIYLVKYNSLGALGIVLNHPTKVLISEAMPHLKWLKDSRIALFWGGPVEQNLLTVLTLSRDAIPGTKHVAGDLYAGWDITLFKDFFVKGSGEINAVRAYGGYAGWAPGQLEREVMRGGWRVVEADEANIFRDTSKLWFRLMGRP